MNTRRKWNTQNTLIQVTITSSIRFRNRSKCTHAGNNYIIIQLKCKIHYLRLQTQDSRSRPWPWALLAVVLIRILAEVLRSHGLAIRLCLFLLDVGSGFIILCCVFPLFWGSRAVWLSNSVWLPFSVPKSGWFSLFWLASFLHSETLPGETYYENVDFAWEGLQKSQFHRSQNSLTFWFHFGSYFGVFFF